MPTAFQLQSEWYYNCEVAAAISLIPIINEVDF